MRTDLEKKLAILSLKKELKTVPKLTEFDDDNHKAIKLAIKLVKGMCSMDEICEMEEMGEITTYERDTAKSFYEWLKIENINLLDLLFDQKIW